MINPNVGPIFEVKVTKGSLKYGVKFEIISMHLGYVSVKGLDFKLSPLI